MRRIFLDLERHTLERMNKLDSLSINRARSYKILNLFKLFNRHGQAQPTPMRRGLPVNHPYQLNNQLILAH